MLITKTITTGLNIQNIINLYSDLDNNIRNILTDRFQGICFKGAFIKSINKVIRTSDCVINAEGPPSFGVIYVIFEVTAIVFAAGEIINGCEVIAKNKGIIMCATPIANIMLSAGEMFDSVQKGQLISVRVGETKYNEGAAKVSISAVPFMFVKVPVVYEMPPLTPDVKLYLQPIMDQIQAEEQAATRLREQNQKAWEFFSQLLYAYKEEQKVPTGAAELNMINIVDKFPKEIQYLSRDARINLSKPSVYGYKDAAGLPTDAVIKRGHTAKDVLLVLLSNYCNHLRTIREMIETYNTEKLLETHKNLWIIFKRAKF